MSPEDLVKAFEIKREEREKKERRKRRRKRRRGKERKGNDNTREKWGGGGSSLWVAAVVKNTNEPNEKSAFWSCCIKCIACCAPTDRRMDYQKLIGLGDPDLYANFRRLKSILLA